MSISRLFMTGATGWVGPAVLSQLRGEGYAVTALVRRRTQLEGATTVIGDLGRPDTYSRAVSAADAIVHLASPRSSDRFRVLSEDVLGVASMIDAWARGPFVYASSSSLHGVPSGVIRDDSPAHITRWYDLGKFINEFQLLAASGTFDHLFPDGSAGAAPGTAVLLRPVIYLGGNRQRAEGQMVEVVYNNLAAGNSFLFDSEEGLETYGLSFVGADDFGRAVSASLKLTQTGPYEVAGGFTTWRLFIETVARLMTVSPRFVVRAAAVPQQGEFRVSQSRYEQDSSLFRQRTGWSPEQSLEELVETHVRAKQQPSRA